MMMLAMAAAAPPAFLNQVLLAAADINNGALQLPLLENTGQGLPISNLSNRVTIYYSKNDDVLPSQSFVQGLSQSVLSRPLGSRGALQLQHRGAAS
jgi:hypothetical protein